MDPSELEPTPEERMNPLAERLGRWRPAPGILDRDRMMFEAGRAAARSESFRLSALVSAACLVLVAAGLGGLLVHERGERRALESRLAAKVQGPVVPLPAPTAVVEADPDSYLMLTHRMDGLAPLDVLSATPDPPPARHSAPIHPPLSPLRGLGVGGGIEL